MVGRLGLLNTFLIYDIFNLTKGLSGCNSIITSICVLSAHPMQLAYLYTQDKAVSRTDITPRLLSNRQRQTIVMLNSVLGHERKKRERW